MTGDPRQRRRNLPFVLGLLAIGATVPLAWWAFLYEPPPAPLLKVESPAVKGPPKKMELKLSQLSGKVQVKRANGEWVEAKQGDTLNPADGVRTEDGSYAVVVGGEFWEVKMEPGTEVAVGELSESISKILLENGMARATVKGQGRHSFEVKAAGGDALARTENGSFSISNNGNGTVAVGAQDGSVEFSGKGRVVIVRAGQQSIIRPGQAPSEPVAIPSSLLLKVALPTRSQVNKSKLLVVGSAEPGTQVEIGGVCVPVDAKGQFKTQLKLKEGQNGIAIRAWSVGGLEASSAHQIELDTTVKKTTIDPNLWGTKPP